MDKAVPCKQVGAVEQAVYMMDIFDWCMCVLFFAKAPNNNFLVTFPNKDLPSIVNVEPNFPIEKCQFYYCFTPAKIFNNLMNIDFIPFTYQCPNIENVWHMMVQEGVMEGKIKINLRE